MTSDNPCERINLKFNNYVIIVILKSEPVGKMINRIPGLPLLTSNLPGSALRMYGKPLNSRSALKALPRKLDIKTHLVFSLWNPSSCKVCNNFKTKKIQGLKYFMIWKFKPVTP